MRDDVLVSDPASIGEEALLALWRRYISQGQTTLIGAFGFGHDRPVSALGSTIRLSDGRRILDFTGGIGVLNHGHNHPKILSARIEYQRQNNLEVHKNYFSPHAAALAQAWAALMPGDLNMCFFPNSGAEAVEGAVKLGFKYHGGRRGTILRSNIAFHGKLLGSGGLTASPELNFSFPTIPGIDTFLYNDIESVKRAIGRHEDSTGRNDVYALIIEPFSASTLRYCSESFLRQLSEVCAAKDIVLIFDEVYTGWAKTGPLFNFMRCKGLVPDVVTTSKSFGGGKSSISGYISRSPIHEKAYGETKDATLHSTTYFGFGEEAATALAALRVAVDDDFPGKAMALGSAISEGLRHLCDKYPDFYLEHRGEGALHGIRVAPVAEGLFRVASALPGPWKEDLQFAQKLAVGAVINRLYDNHKMLTYFASNDPIMLIVAPSLITTLDEVRALLDALDECARRGISRLIFEFANAVVTR